MSSTSGKGYLSLVRGGTNEGQPRHDDRGHILHYKHPLYRIPSPGQLPCDRTDDDAPAPVIPITSAAGADPVHQGIVDLVTDIYHDLTDDLVDYMEMKLGSGITLPGIAPTTLLLLRPPNQWIRRIPGVQCITDDGSGGLTVHYRGNDGPVCLEYDGSIGRLAIPVVPSELEMFLSSQEGIAGGIEVLMFTLGMRRSEFRSEHIVVTYFSRVRKLDVVAPEGLTALTTIYSALGNESALKKFLYFGQKQAPPGSARY